MTDPQKTDDEKRVVLPTMWGQLIIEEDGTSHFEDREDEEKKNDEQ